MVNENCASNYHTLGFIVRMNPLLVQILNTKGKMDKINNSTDCNTRMRWHLWSHWNSIVEEAQNRGRNGGISLSLTFLLLVV